MSERLFVEEIIQTYSRERQLLTINCEPDPYGEIAAERERTRLMIEEKNLKIALDKIRKEKEEVKNSHRNPKSKLKENEKKLAEIRENIRATELLRQRHNMTSSKEKFFQFVEKVTFCRIWLLESTYMKMLPQMTIFKNSLQLIDEDARRNHMPNLSEEPESEEAQNDHPSNIMTFHASISLQHLPKTAADLGNPIIIDSPAIENSAAPTAASSSNAELSPATPASTSGIFLAPGCSNAITNVCNIIRIVNIQTYHLFKSYIIYTLILFIRVYTFFHRSRLLKRQQGASEKI